MEENILLPDDFAPDTAQPQAEEETQEAVETVEDTKLTETVEEQPKVRLKYNHEEKEYSLDDVVPLAQKGLNYDKLQEKFNAIQANPALSKYSKVQEISSLLGYQSDDELLDDLYKTYYNNTAKEEGLTPEQVKKEHELNQKEKVVNAKVLEEQKKQKDTEMYIRFMDKFPNIKTEDIKPETWAEVHGGMDLTAAYIEQRNKELESKVKILEQNNKNTKKAPVGSVTTHGDTQTNVDPFEIGFDSIR